MSKGPNTISWSHVSDWLNVCTPIIKLFLLAINCNVSFLTACGLEANVGRPRSQTRTLPPAQCQRRAERHRWTAASWLVVLICCKHNVNLLMWPQPQQLLLVMHLCLVSQRETGVRARITNGANVRPAADLDQGSGRFYNSAYSTGHYNECTGQDNKQVSSSQRERRGSEFTASKWRVLSSQCFEMLFSDDYCSFFRLHLLWY